MTYKKALVVGINDYGPGIQLNDCIKDAESVAQVLERNFNGELNYEVKKMINVKTKDELAQNIRDLFDNNGNSALLYFSGHGYVDDDGKASLVTPDVTPNFPGVPMDDILNWANKSSIKNKLVILDCCFSGNMGNFSGDGTKSNLGDGVTILTASKNDQTAMEINGHGLFTALLLESLEGGASDILGNVTPGNIYSYIDKALGIWGQRPVFKSNVSSFDIIRKVTPPIEIKIVQELPNLFSMDNKIDLDPSFEYTNVPDEKHEIKEPYAEEGNTVKFKKLQKLVSVGLVRPVESEFMYTAAMESKSCELTPLGEYYLKLVREKRL
ncbi:caspase family protein [Listeria seeligeri]|uniref:caspase family protein n=1 Tax=Listeria seeligeri TaxID=1640 RepID=UPI0018881567|nr:caspase family protein [Listeria seeligeri]MBF2355990.1 caspase family protein [Listeria seeligeri]MBF2375156.1 caspase family protein [Listeria seeligeri]UCK61832.1 caspase family protein [Listeria seeligeri]